MPLEIDIKWLVEEMNEANPTKIPGSKTEKTVIIVRKMQIANARKNAII